MSGTSITGKKIALALIPKFTGFLSLVGSLFVIYDIVRRNSRNGSSMTVGVMTIGVKRKNTLFHRIMLGLSFFDSMASIVNVLSTWPTPSDQGDVVFGAFGNTTTCTIQGFFNEFGNITTPLYSASLCVWYLLFLKYGWREKECEGAEYMFHVIPITVGFCMAVIGLPLNLYNNSGFLCWYAPYPAGCDKAVPHTCTRGEYAGVFRWIHYGIVWSSIAFVTYAMASIYFAVRLQEQIAIDRKTIMSNTARRKSRAVLEQALLYVCALYLTWAFTTATRISQTAFKFNCYQLLILMATFFPLQGFWNALIYFRPRYQKHRQRQRSTLPHLVDNISTDSPDLIGPDREEALPSQTELEVEPIDIWRRVKLRQLERADAAVKRALEDEKIRLEQEEKEERRIRLNSETSQRDEEGSSSVSLATKPVEIWKIVKMRQSERAEAAVKKAQDDEKEHLERKKEKKMKIRLDPEASMQDEEGSMSIEFMDSAELERRISVIHPSPDTPTSTGHSQKSDLRKSFWKTVLPL